VSDALERSLLGDLRLLDLGRHPYKGIHEEVQVFQVTNSLLRERVFPPLRTEKAEEEVDAEIEAEEVEEVNV
jgi:class 3 adenylate cyclase